MPKKIALIGGGRMGQAMMQGWLSQGLDLEISLFDPVLPPLWGEKLADAGWKHNPEVPEIYDAIIIAVKPQSFAQIASDVLPRLVDEDCMVVSIMAGISLEKLQEATMAKRICRAMPNTPGQIGAGITGIIGNSNFENADYDAVTALLSPLGGVVRLEKEVQIDGVTAVSGSGPAYVFLMAESLAAAGVSEGLSPEISQKLAIETIYGAALLMRETGREPLELRKEVTSPNGTTQAAIDVLLAGGGLLKLMDNAVKAAAKRSRELGK